MNAISFGEGTERARLRTVDYIKSSEAGFYILGQRLTTAAVVKVMYISCVIVFGMLTKAGSGNESLVALT